MQRRSVSGIRVALVALVALVAACLLSCIGPTPATGPRGPDGLDVGGENSGKALGVAIAPIDVLEDDAVVPIAADDPVRGGRNAFVTIVVFSDFQCSYCAKLAGIFEHVQATYGEDVRIVFKNDPLSFHPYARLAAQVGQAVFALKGRESFWRYHDLAFRRQQLMSPDAIRAWAVTAGVDARDVEDGKSLEKWAAKVERDEALAKRLGVNGTPGSFVNGISVPGAVAFEKWQAVIDAELVKAKDLAKSGVSRDRVYARLAAANFQEAQLQGDADDDDDKPDLNVWKVPVGASPVLGSTSALVTVVEFGDFECSFCKKVQPTLDRIRNTYGDRVRFVWKDDPLAFHRRAMPAALIARATRAQKGDAAFWRIHDKLFDAQPRLEDSDLETIAKGLGVDMPKAEAAIKARTFAKGIDDDTDLADDTLANGTPHFFINGRRVVGAESFEKLKLVIDAEMTKAEALVRGGVAKTAIYDAIMKDAKGAAEPERKTVAASTVTTPFRGAANAKVVIHEYSDFQCPFCSRVEPTIDELLKLFPGKVKVVWRNLPLSFHADAELAAEAAREAFVQKGNDGFSKMRELLFLHQKDADGLKRAALEGYAVTLGLDMKRFGKALDDGTHKAAIAADKKAADDAGISGTPAFTVGPYFVSGAQPIGRFRRLVERVLAPPVQPAQPPQVAQATVTLPGGLIVKDVAIGTGPAVKSGDTVSVHYVGTLTDGTEFDSSRKHGQPFSFGVGKGQVIKGWDAGLIGMKVGGRRKLTIPPDLAYGDRGAPGAIPPKSTLLFDIELLSIP